MKKHKDFIKTHKKEKEREESRKNRKQTFF